MNPFNRAGMARTLHAHLETYFYFLWKWKLHTNKNNKKLYSLKILDLTLKI